MRDKILNDLFKSQELKDLINKMEPAELRDDLTQELALILCELDPDKLAALAGSNQLKFFVARIVVRMIQSKNSRFYYKFRRYKQDEKNLTELGFNNLGEEGDTSAEEWRYLSGALEIIQAGQVEEVTPLQKEAAFTDLVDRTNQAIEDLPPYHKALLKWYLEFGTASAVVEDMKQKLKGRSISKRTIRRGVREAKLLIQKQVSLC